jgi:peptidoglycan lytic transglycosylase G
VFAIFAAWFLFSLFQPFKGDGEGEVRVQIPTGATVTEIGDILEENDVIASAFFFRTRVTLGGDRGDLKPGSYKLNEDMSYGAVIDALSEGPPKDIVTVTIPEGRSRAEIAPLAKQAGLEGSYEEASVGSPAIDLSEYKAGSAKDLEGFLFPATYELKSGANVKDLVNKQLAEFEGQFDGVDMRYAKSKNLTPYDILIIASMVEREAGVDEDRPLIASVIYNRLKAGMPLGIDATIRFALNQWTEPLKMSELESPSPYNTRTNANLPPGPIGNPGIDSIEAAAHPAKTDYLFFVVKPCGEGEHVFAETDAEFQQYVDQYNAERARQGGKSPTDC